MLKLPGYKPYFGLNTKYRAKFDRKMRPCLTMTLIQFFIPQPTPLINVVTSEILVFAGSMGQKVSSTVYGRTVDKDTGKKQINAPGFYSCELN
jgi:hypothetical protein